MVAVGSQKVDESFSERERSRTVHRLQAPLGGNHQPGGDRHQATGRYHVQRR
jgi:hypothetical protein